MLVGRCKLVVYYAGGNGAYNSIADVNSTSLYVGRTSDPVAH